MSGVGAGSTRNSGNDAATTAQFGGESTAEAASATRDEGDFLGEIKGVVHGIHGCTQRYGEIATE